MMTDQDHDAARALADEIFTLLPDHRNAVAISALTNILADILISAPPDDRDLYVERTIEGLRKCVAHKLLHGARTVGGVH
jgi:hypothetical protein